MRPVELFDGSTGRLACPRACGDIAMVETKAFVFTDIVKAIYAANLVYFVILGT